MEGELIWLVASIASCIDVPIPGFILKECKVEDEVRAAKINRLTRIAALLTKGVDEAFLHQTKNGDCSKDSSSGTNVNVNSRRRSSTSSLIPDIADDLKVLQSLIDSDASQTGNSSQIQSLIKNIGGSRSGESSAASSDCEESANNKHEIAESSTKTTKGRSLDASPSVLESISSGPSIDISKISLTPEEVKLVALIISGELSVHQLAKHIFDTGNPPVDTREVLERCNISLNRRQAKNRGDRERPASWNVFPRNNPKSSFTFDKSPLQKKLIPIVSPPLVNLNLSHSRIGNTGMVILSEALYSNTPNLKCLDISFCEIHEKGFLSLCRALVKRRQKGVASLQGLILTGNTISYRAARDLGLALCHKKDKTRKRLSFHHLSDHQKEGYMEDDEYDYEEDDDDFDGTQFGGLKRRMSAHNTKKTSKKEKVSHNEFTEKKEDPGIQLLHLASTSLDPTSLAQILLGLGEASQIREIDISSNNFGVEGISPFADYLEGTGRGQQVMSKLDRLNISNNHIGDDGLAKITRAISKRSKINSMVDIHLSFNAIGSGGTGTLMNKLLSQNVVTLSLDNNMLGDAGCQLVAASLTSMHHLSSLNLSFNQIGSRGVTTLMRALIGCESLTFLGLSGNVMKISGAIAMGFALAQHPRIAHLELYNCCLSQVAQCHIVTGIISNRWVPLQVLNGFCVGPPMAEIGALDPVAQHLGNTECFTIRRNVQMKAILQWVEASKRGEGCAKNFQTTETDYNDFQSLDFVTPNQNNNGAPSQSAFMRMLEWLSRIPFDEEELKCLRQYFYDSDDSPDGLRGSNGKINLRYRGDLLAALGSGVMKEMRDDEKRIVFPDGPSVGLDIDGSSCSLEGDADSEKLNILGNNKKSDKFNRRIRNEEAKHTADCYRENEEASPASSTSKVSGASTNGSHSSLSHISHGSKSSKCKARITMFPKFFEKLDLLKLNAQEMMNNEFDQARQDLIAQQFAEASLILLRQLRYQCMSSGLDGWRHGKIRRKVLIVDDSKVTRKLVGRAFEKANFIVDTAENGEEGVRMMKESVYDIAFMDIDMPVMNGFDATKALREWEDSKRPGARQPICALTATYVDDFEVHELMKFKEAGLDVMESKPCNIPRLLKVVDDVSPLFSDLSISVTKHLEPSSSSSLQG